MRLADYFMGGNLYLIYLVIEVTRTNLNRGRRSGLECRRVLE